MRKEKLCRYKIFSSEYLCCLIYHCPYWGQSIFVTVGNYIVSNQLFAGSIMVRCMIFILVLSLPLTVYCLMRCTQNALWGVIMNSFDSTSSYFLLSLLSLERSERFDVTEWFLHTFSVLYGFCCLLKT